MPTYNFVSTPTVMPEGVTETILVTGFPIATSLAWEIQSANSPTIGLGSNFTAISGTFLTDSNGEGKFSITSIADKTTEKVAYRVFNILIYDKLTGSRTLYLSTAPNVIQLKDTSRGVGGAVTFASVPTSVTEDNTYTISVNAPGYLDDTKLLAGIYISGQVQYTYGATLTSGGLYSYTAPTTMSGTGITAKDFDFDNPSSVWNIVYPITTATGTTKSRIYYATEFTVFDEKGSFTLTINADELKEDATAENFKIIIFDPSTPRSGSAEYQMLAQSSSINIIDKLGAAVQWLGGTLSWNIPTTKIFSASYLLTSSLTLKISLTGARLPATNSKLYWEIWLEPRWDDPRPFDNMLMQEFTSVSGLFTMSNGAATTSGCTGSFQIVIRALPTNSSTGVKLTAWPERTFNIRVRESPNGRILLTTVGRNFTKQTFYKSLVSNNLNQDPKNIYVGISNQYWSRVDYNDAVKFNPDIVSIPVWKSTTTYTKDTIIRVELGTPVSVSYARVEASFFDSTKGTGVWSGTDFTWLSLLTNGQYGYTAPTAFGSLVTRTFNGNYSATGGIYKLDEGTSVDITYRATNISPGSLVKWSTGTYPAGSILNQTDFLSATSGWAIVSDDLTWKATIRTLVNSSTAVGQQGFSLPLFNAYVNDTSIGTGSVAINRYTISTIPSVVYPTKTFPIRILVDNSVSVGQPVNVYIYTNNTFGTVTTELNGSPISNTNTTVPGTSFSAITFTAIVTESRVLIILVNFNVLNLIIATTFLGIALYEAGVIQLNYSQTIIKSLTSSAYNTSYDLPFSSYGIQIFSPKTTARQIIYNTNAVTWNQVDIFTVAGGDSVTKDYSFLSGREIKVQQILLNAPPVDRKAVAHTCAVLGTLVRVSGGSETAQILVLMR